MTAVTSAPQSHMAAPSEPALWLRRWVAASVVLLAVVTVLSAFADDMPASHRILVPIAVPVIVGGWAMELTEKRWSRLTLIAAVVGANVWMTLIGHLSANYLFLILLVAWVGVVGSRVERTAALVLSLVTVLLAVVVDAADGQVAWGSWMSWLAGLVIIWLMALVLGRQERLVADLRESRADAEQRSHELSTLLTVSRSVASTLEMTPLLDTVLDALNTVVEYSGTAILTLDESGEHLVFAHMRGPASFSWAAARQIRYPIAELEPVWSRLRQEEPVFVGDIRAPDVDAATFRKLVGTDELDTTYSFIRSVMWVPLVARGRVIGILSVANSTPNAFGPREATLALGIARQAAVAIENARLHERARQAAALEERERLARELHDSVTQSLYGISLYAEAAA